MFKKFYAFILIFAILLLSACSAGTSDNNDETSAPITEAVTSESAPTPSTRLIDNISDEDIAELGLDGYQFTVYLRNGTPWENKDIAVTEITGDLLNDTAYDRNLMLEDKFGFTIYGVRGSNGTLSDLKPLIISGDTTMDLAFPSPSQAGSYAQEGLLTDLNTVDYLDLSSQGWAHMFNDTVSIMNKQFYATGDLTVISYNAIRVFMFDKLLLSDYNLESPYELVKSGGWTIDKFEELAKTTAEDIDGDGAMTINDRWGFTWQTAMSGLPFFFGSDAHMSLKDEDDIPYLALDDEHTYDVYDRVLQLISKTDTYYMGSDADVKQIFSNGMSLFFAEALYLVEQFRVNDRDFGLLPVPKFDEKQENHIQYVDGFCSSPATVPICTSNADRCGLLLQLLAETGYEYIRPVYYDKCLEGKSLRDVESTEMLDIIISNYVLDNGIMFNWGGYYDGIKVAFAQKEGLSSFVAANQIKIEKMLAQTISDIQANTSGENQLKRTFA